MPPPWRKNRSQYEPEASWADRHPAKISELIQKRLEKLPKPIQDIAWKAQVRLCKRFRRLVARGKNPNVVVTAIARARVRETGPSAA